MSEEFNLEPMVDLFIFETVQLIEQLEQEILSCEEAESFSYQSINEVFRIMHTIKGSASMMLYDNISRLTHSLEDLFYMLREQNPPELDCSMLSDIVLEGIDFIKKEVERIKNEDGTDGDPSLIIEKARLFILRYGELAGKDEKKRDREEKGAQKYYITSQNRPAETRPNIGFKALIRFVADCGMENIRAFTVLHQLKDIADVYSYVPEDLTENDSTYKIIQEEGFTVYFKSDKTYEKIEEFFQGILFLEHLELVPMDDGDIKACFTPESKAGKYQSINLQTEKKGDYNDQDHKEQQISQSFISVSVNKLDKLMDLVGEIVIAELMVTGNPDLKGLDLSNFQKSARQLKKITGELQDTVMSIRMVPLVSTFHQMYRLARDTSKKIGKEVHLEVVGERTEVDKNIIEHISDPLMHLIRNAVDHGIEYPEERVKKGKERAGKVVLEAKSAGSDVLIIIKDDGKGLNKEKILERAEQNGLLIKPAEEMSEKEIYSLIFLPGFSTKEEVSELSGRGVGMDVVWRNIRAVNGSVSIESVPDQGCTINLKIPLTLAIIDGMNIRVGGSVYTIPTISIKESFRPLEKQVIKDPDGNEMLMVRGQCLPVVRLHQLYQVKTKVQNIEEGIIVMVQEDDRVACLFADELLGEQQVVVKGLPAYIRKIKEIDGLAGCAVLGDGGISLILDVAGLIP